MPHDVFSAGWAEAWREEILASTAYREAARTWQWPLVIKAKPDPGRGWPEQAVYLDLFQGDCREARVAGDAEIASATYVLAADLPTWKRVLDGDLEPIPGLMRGKLKLEKGGLASLLPYVTAAKELVAAATRVESRFPEGV